MQISNGVKFQENVPLKKYTTFKIGGPTRYFFIAKTKQALLKAVKEAGKRQLPLFILGGGSNLLVSSKGFKGLVIKIENCKLKIENCKIVAEAGTSLSQLVNFALKNGLTGLEWAAGIPGTVGGAVFGDAGAFSKSMRDVISSVEIFDAKRNLIRKLKNKECRFGYRQSIFKTLHQSKARCRTGPEPKQSFWFRENPNFIILSCELKLNKRDKSEIKKEMRGYLDYRDIFHPKTPSAGSIFMNPRGYAARELIDICGLKGKRIGGAQISHLHSNFIVNLGKGTSQNVLDLIKLIKKTVSRKFKIKIKEEIIVLE